MTLNGIAICKSFLLSGDDLPLSENLTVKHPSVGDILKLGKGIYCDYVYLSYVSTLLSDPYDNMVWLDDRSIDYESVSAFDVFLMRIEAIISSSDTGTEEEVLEKKREFETIGGALNFFLGEHVFSIGVDDNNKKILYDADQEDVIIDSYVFNFITTFIAMINAINYNDRIKPATKSAKMILIEDKRHEIKRRLLKNEETANDDFIGNIISAVVNGGNGGITPFNFKDLKYYQLYSAMSVEQKKMHFNHVMGGVYQGTVSYDKIGEQEKNWMQ